MVLVDEEGTRIHATIEDDMIKKYQNVIKDLKQGITITIKAFHLKDYCGDYRTSPLFHKILVIRTSAIKVVEESIVSFPEKYFADFQDIKDGRLNKDVLIDVIGQILNVGPIEKIAQKGKNTTTTKVDIELRDALDVRLKCTLWEEFGKMVVDYTEQNNKEVVVCIIRFVCDDKVYLSSDSIDPSDIDLDNDFVYPTEFLNIVKLGGLPKHCLKLKVGAPIMCLRNIDHKGGLCNGTRLIVTQLARHVIEGRIITANDKPGEKVLIPRMSVTPPETKFPFRMRRRQFPVTLAFAITINKSQGQTLKNVGLFLPKPVFSHGQLYVALSKVKSRSGLKILITNKDGKVQKKTMNVVYKEVFQNIQ